MFYSPRSFMILRGKSTGHFDDISRPARGMDDETMGTPPRGPASGARLITSLRLAGRWACHPEPCLPERGGAWRGGARWSVRRALQRRCLNADEMLTSDSGWPRARHASGTPRSAAPGCAPGGRLGLRHARDARRHAAPRPGTLPRAAPGQPGRG